MKRHTQTLPEIVEKLSELETTWRDPFAERVVNTLGAMDDKPEYDRSDLARLLDADFEAALTAFRLFLDRSKDEFTADLRKLAAELGGISRGAYLREREKYLDILDHLLIRQAIAATTTRAYSWRDLMLERLKGGRGSAIKGQKRGRDLEAFVEEIVERVFGEGRYDSRCSFTGRSGSTEKADFAIPSKTDPRVLIEVKAYGATGSKQTDVLGDMSRMIEQKRPDALLLLVTDGKTWEQRTSDLAKLVKQQNAGNIYRIYTKRMAPELESDLSQIRSEMGL